MHVDVDKECFAGTGSREPRLTAYYLLNSFWSAFGSFNSEGGAAIRLPVSAQSRTHLSINNSERLEAMKIQ